MDKRDSRWRRRRDAYHALLAGLGFLGAFLILGGLGYAGRSWLLALLGITSIFFSWRQSQALRHEGRATRPRRLR